MMDVISVISETSTERPTILADEFISYIEGILDVEETSMNSDGSTVYILYLEEEKARELAQNCRKAMNTFLPDKVRVDTTNSATAISIGVPIKIKSGKILLDQFEIIIVPSIEKGEYLVNIIKSSKEQSVH